MLILRSRFQFKALQPASTRLCQSYLDVFDFYRATMPVQHAKLIEQVPSLGMQFVNDCDWLAAQVAAAFDQQHTRAGLDVELVSRSVAGLQHLAVSESLRQIVRLFVDRNIR